MFLRLNNIASNGSAPKKFINQSANKASNSTKMRTSHRMRNRSYTLPVMLPVIPEIEDGDLFFGINEVEYAFDSFVFLENHPEMLPVRDKKPSETYKDTVNSRRFGRKINSRGSKSSL